MSDVTAATESNAIISSAAPVAALFGLSAQLIEKSYADLKDEHLFARANEHSNSMHWILGHITDARYEVARLLGSDAAHDFGKLFSMSAEIKEESKYPSLNDVLESYRSIVKVTDQRFALISEEGFCAEAKNAFPSQDKTICGCVTFLNFHETYHLGQIALLRKFFGYDSLVG